MNKIVYFFRAQSAREKYLDSIKILRETMRENADSLDNAIKIVNYCSRCLKNIADEIPDALANDWSYCFDSDYDG